MTHRLVGNGEFAAEPLRILDGGARHGIESMWSVYGPQAEIWAFEAEAEEHARLDALTPAPSGLRTRYHGVGLAGARGERELHVARYLDASSLFALDDAKARRFGVFPAIEQLDSTTIPTVDIDSFVAEQGLAGPDAMKLDIEGAELEVLEGATVALASTVVVVAEVWFNGVHTGRAQFTDIDTLLSRSGFALFDLRGLNRWSRSTASQRGYPAAIGAGQLMYANAIYLRDLPAQIAEGQEPSRRSAMALASIAEILCYPDFAAEVLMSADGVLRPGESQRLCALLGGQSAASQRWHTLARRAVRRTIPPVARRRLSDAVRRIVSE